MRENGFADRARIGLPSLPAAITPDESLRRHPLQRRDTLPITRIMGAPRRTRELRAWLQQDPPLAELREAFPQEWLLVSRELEAVTGSGDPAALAAYAQRVANPGPVPRGARPSASGLDPRLAALVRQRMAASAIRTIGLRAATGVDGPTLRLGRRTGRILQRLLFADGGFTRKPVSLRLFRLVWPRLRQRARLMPLVQQRGIYCFYSDALIRELAAVVGDRPVLEIAAGDGTLARFLRDAGVQITATDDHSWSAVAVADDVRSMDAARALREHPAPVVLCSWPPAGNGFEAAVFTTPGVEEYLVIGNRQTAGWGNPQAYAAAERAGWVCSDAPELARLVLPPEAEPVILRFQRSASQGSSTPST